jgi:hypothetical protein
MNVRLSLQELIKLAVEGFGMLQDSGQIEPRELQLTSMEVLNDSALVASVVPSVSDSIGIKIEACTVMSFMSSFFEEDFALPPNIKNLGVRAFTSDGDELMYVLSSRETAHYCSQGRAIEWLKNSIFQDNTPEQRAARAKLLISRIEVGLRIAIAKRLEQRYGKTWWGTAVPKGIQNQGATATGRALGGAVTGSQLIEYTYLRHLKDIALQNWDEFKDILTDAGKFERAMDDLNGIRRDEAHNRPISQLQIAALEGLYAYLAGAATAVDPHAVPEYLVENWRDRLSTIINETSKAMPEMLDTDRQNPALVRAKFDSCATAFEDGLARLKSVVVPPGKEELHKELQDHWARVCKALGEMKAAADSGDTTRLEAAAAEHQETLGRLKAFAGTYLMSELGR